MEKITDKPIRVFKYGEEMKLLLGFLILTIFTVSCDAPVRTRVPTAPSYDSISDQEFVKPDGPGVTTGDNGTIGTTGTNGGGSSEPGFDNCDISLQYSGGNVGYFGMCQHSSDERRFKVTFAQSSTAGTCFVPVHVQNGGNSYKLGIAECVHNQANTPYYMTLNKEMMPPTFSYPRAEQVNGVMVIAANSVNAYMGCMNAKEDYYISTNGCCYQQVPYNGRLYCLQPNQQCESAANSYANSVCSTFVQNHSNNYRQVSF